jgi:siroheme synthase
VRRGSLTVVGTGIRAGIQLTPEARAAIERADRVLFLVAEQVAAEAIRRLSPNAESLEGLYEPGAERAAVYESMVEKIMEPVRAGFSVCAAFYGHPGVFSRPAHGSVRKARLEGFEAEMLPGISAFDCLLADLGLDPGASGCQCYEATSFLRSQPAVDTGALLVLWQVSAVGRTDTIVEPDLRQLPLLATKLVELYGPGREAVVYEASPFPVGGPYIRRLRLADLAAESLPPLATLVICPPDQADGVPAAASSSSDRTDAAATVLPLAE